jgi:hypothetical protein
MRRKHRVVYSLNGTPSKTSGCFGAKAYLKIEYRNLGTAANRLNVGAPMFPARDIKIGTSGYSNPGPPPKGWYGAFYPEKKTKGFDELKYYSKVFNTCEINSTFYRPPAPAITTAWATKTPDDFLFAIKLWQKFTHPMKIGRKGSGGDPVMYDSIVTIFPPVGCIT